MKKLLTLIHRVPLWLGILLFIIFLLRIPSFFEPYYYGDEMIYLTLGRGIRNGVTLYKNLHDNKPPLIYLVAGLSGNLFWFKTILAFWNITSIFIFWKLVSALFSKNKNLIRLAVILFGLLTTLPFLEGNIANAELFMVGLTVLGFWLVITKKPDFKNLFIAGAVFSLAALFKVPAAFDIGAVIIYWLITGESKGINFKTVTIRSINLLAGFLTPIVISLVWYFLAGAGKEYFVAAFMQNLGYVSSWHRGSTSISFWDKNLPLLIRAAIAFGGVVFLLVKRRLFSREFIVICSWLFFSLFATTLSERPYPHYIIQALPAVSVLLAILFTDKTKLQTYTIIPLTIAFMVPVYFKFWIYPTVSYYQRFAGYLLGSTTKDQYFTQFRNNINRNYQIARLVKSLTKEGESIFVWGDDASIYALSRRLPPIKYVADYHIKDFSTSDEIISGLNQNRPQIIVYLTESSSFPELKSFIQKYYLPILDLEGGRVYKLSKSRVK